nr:hypothetical protein [Candidatus Cloacimonadota bacterium]
MGTQQILLIVLSVIIVGAAIAVGIQMFNNQAYSANKTAIAADAQGFASQIVQYYKTPESQGGLGGDFYVGGNDSNSGTLVTDANIGSFIGWGGATTDNDNGEYVIGLKEDSDEIYVYGLGKEVSDNKKPAIKTTITFPAGTITAKVADVAAGTALTVTAIEAAINPSTGG